MDIPFLRSAQDWSDGTPTPAIRAARIVVTMGMPALIYRFFFKRQAWLDALRRLGRRGN